MPSSIPPCASYFWTFLSNARMRMLLQADPYIVVRTDRIYIQTKGSSCASTYNPLIPFLSPFLPLFISFATVLPNKKKN